jgi:hypothetical protein
MTSPQFGCRICSPLLLTRVPASQMCKMILALVVRWKQATRYRCLFLLIKEAQEPLFLR